MSVVVNPQHTCRHWYPIQMGRCYRLKPGKCSKRHSVVLPIVGISLEETAQVQSECVSVQPRLINWSLFCVRRSEVIGDCCHGVQSISGTLATMPNNGRHLSGIENRYI